MPELSLFDVDLRPAEDVRVPLARPAPRPAAPLAARLLAPLLLVVDGNSLAHRAFHAYPSQELASSDGRPRGAVYGFLALLAGICDRVGPDGVVVGFDCCEVSERRSRYPAYKAQRREKDPALTLQLTDLACLLERLDVTVVVPRGWEADDVLGSGAAAAEAVGWRAVLATSDRDAFALVSDTTTVLRLRAGLDRAVEVTPASLARSPGVAPRQYVEFAAMRGDTSDNLPGVPGIGAKRAASLLREYPTVADAVADPLGCRSVLGRPVGQALLDDLAEPDTSVFLRNVALMGIRRDLKIDVEACRPRATPDQVEEHLLAWELPTLVRRTQISLGARPDLPPPPGDADVPW